MLTQNFLIGQRDRERKRVILVPEKCGAYVPQYGTEYHKSVLLSGTKFKFYWYHKMWCLVQLCGTEYHKSVVFSMLVCWSIDLVFCHAYTKLTDCSKRERKRKRFLLVPQNCGV